MHRLRLTIEMNAILEHLFNIIIMKHLYYVYLGLSCGCHFEVFSTYLRHFKPICAGGCKYLNHKRHIYRPFPDNSCLMIMHGIVNVFSALSYEI